MELQDIISEIDNFFSSNKDIDKDTFINYINSARETIHKYSPFAGEPVDFVKWVKNDIVVANEYNPNTVAPPEMELLKLSILSDGYTQPIVTWETEKNIEVIDGFHRNRVGKECLEVRERIYGYLPVVLIKDDRQGKNDRIASTIRHNRARGKHAVSSMSDIVIELKNRNWTNARISKELGMDEDEILRLCQITGLSELFKDDDFSRSWDCDNSEDDIFEFTGEVGEDEKQMHLFRTVNTSDPDRIFHTYDKWECYKAGFYATKMDGMTKEQCELEYAKFLSNDKLFADALEHVIVEWKYSCEHYLTNTSMNRIAYLGQAAMCYATGIPSCYCGGFNLLTEDQQNKANNIALEYLNKWLIKNGRKPVDINAGLSKGRQSQIY